MTVDMIPPAMLNMLQQTAPAPGGGSPFGALGGMLPMLAIFVIFYFLLIAPMRKKQRKTQEMLAKLKKGDEVITGGGIFGRITALDDERGFVILQISDNTKIKVLRSAIAGLAAEPEAVAASSPG
jgi:preprotein translocase subunit YajC